MRRRGSSVQSVHTSSNVIGDGEEQREGEIVASAVCNISAITYPLFTLGITLLSLFRMLIEQKQTYEIFI